MKNSNNFGLFWIFNLQCHLRPSPKNASVIWIFPRELGWLLLLSIM